MSAQTSSLSDVMLVAEVREGSADAYQVLYERHVGAARRFAGQLTRCRAESEDFVSEAFATVLETLRKGGGPTVAFRPYVLAVVRNVAYQHYRRDRRVSLHDDFGDMPGWVSGDDPGSSVAAAAERDLVAKAYARLPKRWRAVLWYTEIEGMSLASTASLLGLTPNGVAALAFRAREGMRQAYLQAHLARTTAKTCRATIDQLGVWARQRLSRRASAQVEAHLDRCTRCRALAAELADLNGRMRAVVAPLLLGSAAAGYLASCDDAAAAASGGATLANGAGSIVPLAQQVAGVVVTAVSLAALALGSTVKPNESRLPVVDARPPVTARSELPADDQPQRPSTPRRVVPRATPVPTDRPTPTRAPAVDPVERTAPAPTKPSGSTPVPQPPRPPQPAVDPSAGSPTVPPAGHRPAPAPDGDIEEQPGLHVTVDIPIDRPVTINTSVSLTVGK